MSREWCFALRVWFCVTLWFVLRRWVPARGVRPSWSRPECSRLTPNRSSCSTRCPSGNSDWRSGRYQLSSCFPSRRSALHFGRGTACSVRSLSVESRKICVSDQPRNSQVLCPGGWSLLSANTRFGLSNLTTYTSWSAIRQTVYKLNFLLHFSNNSSKFSPIRSNTITLYSFSCENQWIYGIPTIIY